MKISRSYQLTVLASAVASAVARVSVAAEPLPPSLITQPPSASSTLVNSDFGGIGLMQAPSARMGADGDFSISIRENDPYRLFTVNLQLLPRLEVTARYVLIPDLPTGFGGSFVDKGFDAKVLLAREGAWSPQLAVGLRDVAGTGLFAGEYVVASKQLGAFDVTAGLGWGYLGRGQPTRNPLCSVADRFCERPTGFTGPGGQVEADKFFAGDMSPFAGVSWQTPHRPLRLLAELDPNDYSQDFTGSFEQKSRINYGLAYRLSDSIDLTVSRQRGDVTTLGLTLNTNFHRFTQPKLPEPALPPADAVAAENNWRALAQQLDRLAGFRVSDIRQGPEGVVVTAQSRRFRDPQQGLGRAFHLLKTNVTPDQPTVTLVTQQANQPLVAYTAQREALVEAFTPSDRTPSLASVVQANNPSPALSEADVVYPDQRPVWSYALQPFLRQNFGGIDEFYFFDVGLAGTVTAQKGNNLLRAAVSGTLIDNYDFRTPDQPSPLPVVRSDIREYLRNRPVRLDQLAATRFASLPEQSLYAQAYAGFFELMYAGVGGELLFRPLGRTWGVGVDVNRVRKRDTNDLGLQNYEVTTGHVSAYKRLPSLYNTQVKLSAGQYLAGDRGATLDVSRTFDSGVVVGAFAAKTNVSAEDFGEGSFHKGFYLSIPLDALTVRHTRTRGGLVWIPIQRDGGQMVGRPQALWDVTSPRAELLSP